MYTTYINNYTQAVDTFQRLQQQPHFAQMVEVRSFLPHPKHFRP